jgi:cytochrome c-type biogenesis protein
MISDLSKFLAETISHPVAGFAAAFLAGVISSIAPCTVTAITLIIGYVGGYAAGNKAKATACTVSFVTGLTIAFVTLGVVASGLGFLFAGPVYRALLSILVLLMGLNVMGVIRLPMPAINPKIKSGSGIAGAFMLGLITASVSAPCATPVLIAILAMASASTNGIRGILLTTFYAIGHWLPVLIVGITAGFAPSALAKAGFRKLSNAFLQAMGVILVAIGTWMLCTSIVNFF